MATTRDQLPAGPPSTRRPSPGSVATGVPEIVLGVGFFITWRDPSVLGADWVKFAIELMLLEFILIHSAPFMGIAAAGDETIRRRALGFLILGGFYSLFVVGFSLSLHSWRPFITFWVITAQRLTAEVLDPKPTAEAKAWYMTSVALSALLYISLVGLTLIPQLPRLGVTRAIRDGLELTSDGAWATDPHRAVVLAGCYYLTRGLLTALARPRTAWQQTLPGRTARSA